LCVVRLHPKERVFPMKTIIEPFRIKSVEPIQMRTRKEREELLRKAHYNLFNLNAADVTIDLLTDSGTGAMSTKQWAGIMMGDESYAGSVSFLHFQEVFQSLTGYKHILPTHQGRAAEKILFEVAVKEGQVVLSNSHFDTTRGNIEYRKAEARDLITDAAKNFKAPYAFKGNMDIARLKAILESDEREKIPLVMMTVTNNSWGGQPCSLENIREASKLCRKYGIPFFLDACRFAENAYFIKTRERGQSERSVRDIAREMFSYADGCTFSAKKDAIANIGGMLGLQNDEWAARAKDLLILTEGFPTYGGLAGRDLEAIALGVEEVLDEEYLAYRIASTAYLGKHLAQGGIPILHPAGGHAIFIDARAFVPHISPEQFPALALACELYLHAGIRGVEIGSLMFGKSDPKTGKPICAQQELVRLAIPRRTYTQSHIDYVVEAMAEVYQNREDIRGLRIVEVSPTLRHFSAKLEPVTASSPGGPGNSDAHFRIHH
jgi:tyrosine phenol-lyase